MSKNDEKKVIQAVLNHSCIGFMTYEPIYNARGQMLLAKNKRLNERAVDSLLKHDVEHVWIYVEPAGD